MKLVKAFSNKYKNMSLPVKAAFWFTICSFVQRGITMITTPIFTRLLDTEEYGKYSTYLSWESVLLMITSLCLYKSIMNLYVKYEDQERVLSVVCGLELTVTTIWFVIGMIFCEPISSLLAISPTLTYCLFIYFIAQSAFQCWALYKRYVYDYKKLIFVTLLLTVGSSVLGVISVIFISSTAESRAISALIFLTIVGVVIYSVMFFRTKAFFDKKIWAFALGFYIPLLPHNLSEFILQSSDKIMINYLCGSNDVAIYSIAYSAGSLINLVTSSINSSFAPYQYQKIKSGEYDLLAKRANQVLGFVGVMLILIMLFSKEIVLIFGGSKYIDSVYVIIPICIGVYFNYMFQLFSRVQEYYEKKLMVVIPSILCALLNLILNYIFIRLCGYQAAAYTTFLCYMIFCIMHYFFYRKVCRQKLNGQHLYDIKGLLMISIILIISGVIISFINEVLWLKYSLIGLVLIAVLILHKKIIHYVKHLLKK